MKSLIFLSLLLVYSLARVIPQNKYIVTVTDEAKSENPIKISKGKYTKILLTISEEKETNVSKGPFFPMATKIKLDQGAQNIFTTEYGEYTINPNINKEYEIMIGIKCDTTLPEGETSFSLTFKSQNSEFISFYSFNEFKVEVDTDVTTIDIEPTLTSLPASAKAAFKLTQDLYNIENLKIKFEKIDPSVKGEVHDIEIKKYPSVYAKSSFNGLIGEYSTQKEFDETTTSNKFKVSVNSQCFKLKSDVLEFKTGNKEVQSLADAKKSIVDSIQIIESTEIGAVEVNAILPVAPVTVSCVIDWKYDTQGNYRKDDEIINQSKKDNDFLQYQKYFVTEANTTLNIKFTDLAIMGRYRMKCVIENIGKDDKYEKINLTIGKGKGSDSIQELSPGINTAFNAQCATFTFESFVNPTFEKEAPEYCEYLFSNGESKLANGCVECSSLKKGLIPSLKDKSLTICASSSIYCRSTYQGDAKATFKQFVDDLSSTEKISEIIGVDNVKVVSTSIEIDDAAPDTSKITATVIEKKKEKVSLNITSTNEQNVECLYNHDLDKGEGKKWIIPGSDFFKESITLKPNEYNKFQLKFDSHKQDNKTYSVLFECHYLPGFKNYYHTTGAFSLVSFLITDVKEEDYEKKEKADCTKTPNKPECIGKKAKEFIKEFKSKMPEIIDEIEDEVEEFKQLPSVEQKIKLEIENKTFHDYIKAAKKETKTIINQAIKLAQYLNKRDCLNSTNYDECRKSKKEIQKEIINQLNITYNCSEILTNIKSSEIEQTPEQNLKYLLLLLSDTSENPDSLNQGDSDFLYGLGYCVLDNFKDLWKEVKDSFTDKTQKEIDEIKKDVTDLLVNIVTNLGNMIHYDEADTYLTTTEQEINDAKLLIGSTAKLIRKKIHEAIKLLWEFGNGKHEMGNVNINITYNPSVEVKRLRNLEETKDTISYVDFPDQGVQVGLYLKKLAEKFGAEITQVFVYDKYPLLSIQNNIVSPHFVSIELFKNNGDKIDVSNIDKDFLPEIRFNKTVEGNNFKKCYYYNEDKSDLKEDGVTAEEKDGFVTCKATHFTEFTIGEVESTGMKWWAILLIVLAVIFVIGLGFVGFIMYRKKNANNGIENVNKSPLTV